FACHLARRFDFHRGRSNSSGRPDLRLHWPHKEVDAHSGASAREPARQQALGTRTSSAADGVTYLSTRASSNTWQLSVQWKSHDGEHFARTLNRVNISPSPPTIVRAMTWLTPSTKYGRMSMFILNTLEVSSSGLPNPPSLYCARLRVCSRTQRSS